MLFAKFMELRMRSKDGETTMRSAFTHYYILLVNVQNSEAFHDKV